MAGVLLVIMGLAKLGSMIRFIPQPVITGFTSGIAVIIFSSQVKDLLGLHMGAVPADFITKWISFLQHAASFTPSAMGLSAVTLAVILFWPRVSRRLPGPFVALVLGTVIGRAMHLDVETIGSRFGSLTSGMPHPQMPHVSVAEITSLVGPAFTIAMLAAIESLLSAVVADGMIGGRHRSNMELVAQGVANIASPLFGGIPATGAIARTATNVKNGGRTPIAGMTHALTLLLVTLFFGQYAAMIPLAVLAAILVVVAYHMSEWHTFVAELRSPKSDVAVLLTTFGLTVLVDLTVAISVGMVLAAFLFIRRMASVTNVSAIIGGEEDEDADEPAEPWRRALPAGVTVYEVNGPFFFGAVETFKDTIDHVSNRPKVLIIRLRGVDAMDSTGLRALRDVVRRSRRDGVAVLIAELKPQPLAVLESSPFLDELGREKLCVDMDDAIAHSYGILEQKRAT